MKNKEIEELLNKMKNCNGVFDYYLEYGEVDLLLSYIEQLEKEYNRSLDKLRNLRVENEQLQKELEELKQQDKNKDTRNSRQRVSNAYQIMQNDKLKRRFNTQKRRRKEEAQKKKLYKSRIDKAIEVIDLITPELWNISNAMTYKLKDIKYILKGDSDE